MISASEQISTTGRKNGDSVYFFVSKFVPFVCYINSAFVPFVCRNTPNRYFSGRARTDRGFTLIELIVTMAVAAILVAVAVPNIRTFIQNGRLNTQVNDLLSDIAFARSSAIHSAGIPPNGAGVGICRSINGTACVGGNWKDGRAIFIDLDNNNDWDVGEPILRFREPLTSVNTLAVNGPMPPVISFNVGTSSTSKPNVTNVSGGVFVFCDDRGPAFGKQVSLNAMGQAVVSTNAPASCTPP